MKPTTILLPVVLVAACGGGGGSKAGASSDAADKTAYLKKVEPICATANASRKVLKTPTGVDDLVPYAASVLALSQRVTEQFAAVPPPRADSSQIQAKIIVPLRAEVAAGQVFITKLSAAKAANNLSEISTLLADPPTKTRADLTFMKDYGFVDCTAAADTGS